MKKFYFIATALLITLGACTNDESDPRQEITFKSVNQKSSKAVFHGPMTNVTYDENEHFGVFAFYKVNSTSSGSIFMNNVEIQNDESKWRNVVTKYYWPTEGSLTFACYSPYDFIESTTIDDASIVNASIDKGVVFTGFVASNVIDKQIDLMVADNVTPATNSGVVPVTFKHILSQIKFTAASKIDYSAIPAVTNISKMEIKSIVVHNLKTDGSYIYDEEAHAVKWKNLGETTADYNVSSTATTLNADATAVSVGTPILVIPQDAQLYEWDTDVNNTNKYIIEVSYTVTFKEGTTTNESDKTAYIQPSEEWEKGKIYTYNLQIGLNEITFAPSVADWSDGDSEDMDI